MLPYQWQLTLTQLWKNWAILTALPKATPLLQEPCTEYIVMMYW